MLNCLLLALKALCCVVTVDAKIKTAERTGICLPVKCALALKDCYDQHNATVHPETEHNDIELSGAPSDHAMA